MTRQGGPFRTTSDCRTIAGNTPPAAPTAPLELSTYQPVAATGREAKHPGREVRKPGPKGMDRNSLAYWKKALRRCPRTGNYTVQILFNGRRGTFTFGRQADAAAEKARQVFLSVSSAGTHPEGSKEAWRRTLEVYSPGAFARLLRQEKEEATNAKGGRIEKPTIGDVIRIASELSTARPATLHGYCKALRFIASDVFQVRDTEEVPIQPKKGKAGRGNAGAPVPAVRIKSLRHDYQAGGLVKWRAAVDAIELDRLTPAEIQRWRKMYLERAGTDPAAVDRARVSFNKLIRNARSLFARKLLPFLESRVILPRPLFFEGVAREKEPPMRYRSVIDPAAILKAAAEQLSAENREAFKALFLCLVLGLRRSEADTLLWTNVDFDRREVQIKPTAHNLLKSRDSAREIALDNMALGIFRGWRAQAKGEFVLESSRRTKPFARTPEYRCMRTFEELTAWLRAKGVTADKPIHELRKECGTLLLKQGQPIEAVSRYLGHSSIQITMAHYADIAKQRATVNMMALFQVVSAETTSSSTTQILNSSGIQPAVSGQIECSLTT